MATAVELCRSPPFFECTDQNQREANLLWKLQLLSDNLQEDWRTLKKYGLNVNVNPLFAVSVGYYFK